MDKINNINNYNNIQFGNTNIPKKDVGMPDNFKNLMHSIINAQDHDEVDKILSDAVTDGTLRQRDDYMSYVCGDYIITDMLKHNGESYSRIIKELTKRGIKIAPEYVGAKTFGNYTILVEKISGTNGEDLIPISKGYNLLNDEAKINAYKEVQKLVKAGVICQSLLRGPDVWYITPSDKKLVIPSWYALRKIDNNEAPEILNTIRGYLFQK